MNEKLIELIRYNNIVEQKKIEVTLKENSIKYVVRTFEDMAYNGLYTMYHGLGQILIFEKDYKKAIKLINQIEKEK